MAKKGSWSRERDARKAARDKGLSDEDFEIVKGPKGFTYRMKSKYEPVPDAKLHIKPLPSKEPEEPLNKPVAENVFEGKDGRFRWADETGDLSMESFESIVAAQEAMAKYADQMFGRPPTQEYHQDFITAKGVLPNVTIEKLPLADQVIVKESEDLPPELEQEMKDEGLDPDKEEERVVPTFTEAEQQNILARSEAAKQVASMTGPIPSGTFLPGDGRRIPIPRVHKSTIEGPSKKVWEIAEEMLKANPDTKRKEILEECVRRGIAFYTARTQYQVWLKIQKDSVSHLPQKDQ